LSGLNADEMTATAYTTIALLLAVGISWGIVCMIIFGKKYSSKLSGGNKKSGGPSFGDDAMTAMFIGLITAYIGSYIGTLVQLQDGTLVCTGQYLPLVTLAFSAATMGVFVYLAEKKKQAWVENFSIAGSMLVGMTAAVLCGIIF
jgi:heme A synthase